MNCSTYHLVRFVNAVTGRPDVVHLRNMQEVNDNLVVGVQVDRRGRRPVGAPVALIDADRVLAVAPVRFVAGVLEVVDQ